MALRFGFDLFVAMQTQFGMVFAMFVLYLVARRFLPRYEVLGALALGVVIAAALGLMDFGDTTRNASPP